MRTVAETIRHVEDTIVKAGGAVLRYGGFYGLGATEDQVKLVRKRQPYLAACAGAKPPMRVPTWLARPLAGKKRG